MEHVLLSIKEFALKLKVHPNTIRRSIKCGRISAIKIGSGKRHVYRISTTEILRMAEIDMQQYVELEVQKRIKDRLKKEIQEDTLKKIKQKI